MNKKLPSARNLTRRAQLAGILATLTLAPRARAQTSIKLNVGITNSASDVALFIADARGYFMRDGLDVNFVKFDSAARMIAPFASGDLVVGAGGHSAGLFNAVARGIDIRIVADKPSTPPGRPINFLVVRTDHVTSGRFRQISDLRGMKIGGAAPGGAATTTLYKLLAMGSLKPADVERAYMGFAQQIVALANGAIDACMPTEPYVTKAENDGYGKRIIGDDVIYPYHQLAALFYTGAFVTKQPDAAHKFMRAYIQAARDYNDAVVNGFLAGPKGEDIISILTKYSLVSDPAVHRALAAVHIDPDGKLGVASLKEDLEIYRSDGLIEGNVDMDKVIDASFANAAVKELGPYVRK